MQVSLEDPKRFRIELTFSRGADLSPLESEVSFYRFSLLVCFVSLDFSYFFHLLNFLGNSDTRVID